MNSVKILLLLALVAIAVDCRRKRRTHRRRRTVGDVCETKDGKKLGNLVAAEGGDDKADPVCKSCEDLGLQVNADETACEPKVASATPEAVVARRRKTKFSRRRGPDETPVEATAAPADQKEVGKACASAGADKDGVFAAGAAEGDEPVCVKCEEGTKLEGDACVKSGGGSRKGKFARRSGPEETSATPDATAAVPVEEKAGDVCASEDGGDIDGVWVADDKAKKSLKCKKCENGLNEDGKACKGGRRRRASKKSRKARRSRKL